MQARWVVGEAGVPVAWWTPPLMIFTGMRRGELIGLKLPDVSLREGTVRIRGKGQKERVVPLVDRAVEAVRDWLELRPNHRGHDYLFTTTHGNRIHPSRMQRIWRGIFERTDIEDDGVSLHTLRHSMATLLLQSGEASLPEIQRIPRPLAAGHDGDLSARDGGRTARGGRRASAGEVRRGGFSNHLGETKG